MPPAGLEPTISAGERPQTYALDRAATGTGTTDANIIFKVESVLKQITPLSRRMLTFFTKPFQWRIIHVTECHEAWFSTLPQMYISESATRHDPESDQSISQQDTLYF